MIVKVSSTAGKRPSTGMPDYSVTKAAVLYVFRTLIDDEIAPDLAEIAGAATNFNTNLNTWTAAKATANSAKR